MKQALDEASKKIKPDVVKSIVDSITKNIAALDLRSSVKNN